MKQDDWNQLIKVPQEPRLNSKRGKGFDSVRTNRLLFKCGHVRLWDAQTSLCFWTTAAQLSALLQPSPAAPQSLAPSPAGSLGLPVLSPATSHQFVTPSLGGSSPALSHSIPVTSPGSWPMSPQYTGSGQGSKYRCVFKVARKWTLVSILTMRDRYLTSRRIIQSLVKVRLFWKASLVEPWKNSSN